MSLSSRAVSRRSLFVATGRWFLPTSPQVSPVAARGEAGSLGSWVGDDACRARIDVHHHFSAPAWVDWAESQGLLQRQELPWWAHWNVDATLALMDRVGIATAILTPAMPVRYRSAAQWREGVTIAFQAITDLMSAHPGRFAFFAPLFLDDLDVSLWALRYALDELGAVGVSVRANYNGVYLGDPSYDRVFAELDERAAVLATHPHDLRGSSPDVLTVPGIPNFMCDFMLDTTRAAANLILNRTLDRYPCLSIILPHAGGFLPYIATRIEVSGRFCAPPIDGARVRDYLHRFYYDTAAPMSPSVTPTLVATVAPDRILFGTDLPATPASTLSDIVIPALNADHVLTNRQRRGINRDNALRLMPRLAHNSPSRN